MLLLFWGNTTNKLSNIYSNDSLRVLHFVETETVEDYIDDNFDFRMNKKTVMNKIYKLTKKRIQMNINTTI